MENQKIQIEVDGVEKTAEILEIVELNGSEYAIYTIDKGDETSDIFASRIVKELDGSDRLVDIESEEEKAQILEIIQEMFNE